MRDQVVEARVLGQRRVVVRTLYASALRRKSRRSVHARVGCLLLVWAEVRINEADIQAWPAAVRVHRHDTLGVTRPCGGAPCELAEARGAVSRVASRDLAEESHEEDVLGVHWG